MNKVILKNLSTYIFLITSILVVPLLYSTQTLDPSLTGRSLALSAVTLIFLSYIILITLKDSKRFDFNILNNKIIIFYLAYLFFVGLSVLKAENTTEAIADLFKHLSIFVYLTVSVVFLSKNQHFHITLSKVVTVFSLVILVIGIYQIIGYLMKGVFDHHTSYEISAMFAHRNLYAQIILLSLPFNVYILFTDKSYFRLIAIITTLISLIFITILLTKSVWLAFVIALFVCLVIFLAFIYKRPSKGLGAIKKPLLIAIIVVLVIGFSAILISKISDESIFEKQTYWLKSSQFGSSKERLELWKRSFRMVEENPVSGVGTGNWRILISKYGSENLRSENGEIFFQRPHNDFIWIMSEAGIIAFISYVSLLILVFYYLFQLLRNSKDKNNKLFALCLVFFFVSFCVISFFSFPRERIEHNILVVLAIASVVILHYKTSNPTRHFSRLSFLVTSAPLIIILLISIIINTYRFYGEKWAMNSINYRSSNNWRKVIQAIDKSHNRFYTIDHTSTPLYFYRGIANYNLGHINKAIGDFTKARYANPYHLHVYNNLGTCSELQGNHNKAISFYKQALNISPSYENTLINMCAVYYNKNMVDSAFYYLARCNPESENASYKEFKGIITKDILGKLIETTSDSLIRISLLRIEDSDEWTNKVYLQALENNNQLKKQLLLETVYLLESEDSVISHEVAEKYMEELGLAN
jgi:O-antigen ligase